MIWNNVNQCGIERRIYRVCALEPVHYQKYFGQPLGRIVIKHYVNVFSKKCIHIASLNEVVNEIHIFILISTTFSFRLIVKYVSIFVQGKGWCCILHFPFSPQFFCYLSIALDSRSVIVVWHGLCQRPPSIKRGERIN